MKKQTQDLKVFLDVLIPSLKNEFLEVRMFPADKETKQKTIQNFYKSKTEMVRAFPKLLKMQSKGYGIYFGVCPRKEAKGTKQSVSCIHVLWADIDSKAFNGDKKKALKCLKSFKLKPTIIIDSGNGYHVYWKLKEGVTDKSEIENYLKSIANAINADDTVCEVSRVLRLPGTVNNKEKQVSRPVKIVELNNRAVYQLSDFDFIKKHEKTPITKLLKGVAKGNRDNALTRLTGYWRSKGVDLNQCIEKAEKWNSNNKPPLTKREVAKNVEGNFKRYPTKVTSKNQSTPSPKYSADFKGLVDIVEQDGKPAFLVKDVDKIKVVSEWNDSGDCLKPPPKKAMRWLLPKADEVIKYYTNDNDKQLYEDLLVYCKGISELPSKEYYDLLVTWIFHTYCLEHFRYSPYLYFFAVTERGKTRTGQGLMYASYRGYRTETLNESQIIRLATDCKVSLFIDATDLWENARRKGIEDVLLGRFEKGSTVSRVLFPDKGAFEDTVYYEIFGATIITTNVKVSDVLESRAIEINMPETDKLFDNEIRPEDSLSFRERLVAFRARHLNDKFPEVQKPAKGRLGDILKPLFQVLHLVNSQRESQFLRLVNKIEGARKIERSTGQEAELIKAVISQESHVDKGLLLTELIVNCVNLGKPERYELSKNRVGRDLVALGFEKKPASSGNMAIVYDQEKINRLMTSYGISKNSESSESSE